MYQFNCVTFGDSSLPFLASYVIKRATQDLREGKSGATQTWIKVFISMDDLIHSCKTTQEAKITNCPWRLQILDKRCLSMRNWITMHHPSVLKEIAGRVTPHLLEFREQSQSVPDMKWSRPTDKISFLLHIKEIVWTKGGFHFSRRLRKSCGLKEVFYIS